MLWQLCVLNGGIRIATRDDAAEPRELYYTSRDYGLCAASCKCCEVCGCHFVACDKKKYRGSLEACLMADRGGILQENSVLTGHSTDYMYVGMVRTSRRV